MHVEQRQLLLPYTAMSSTLTISICKPHVQVVRMHTYVVATSYTHRALSEGVRPVTERSFAHQGLALLLPRSEVDAAAAATAGMATH